MRVMKTSLDEIAVQSPGKRRYRACGFWGLFRTNATYQELRQVESASHLSEFY